METPILHTSIKPQNIKEIEMKLTRSWMKTMNGGNVMEILQRQGSDTLNESSVIFQSIMTSMMQSVSTQLSLILPSPINKNLRGFIVGRSITENILLYQEIIQDIDTLKVEGNVVLRLDMTKTFDRVFWPFLCILMRRMTFVKYGLTWFLATSLVISGDTLKFFPSRI